MRDFMRLRRDHKLLELGGSGYFGFHAAIKRRPLLRRIPATRTRAQGRKRTKAAREGLDHGSTVGEGRSVGLNEQSRQAGYDRLTALPGHSGRGAMSGQMLLAQRLRRECELAHNPKQKDRPNRPYRGKLTTNEMTVIASSAAQNQSHCEDSPCSSSLISHSPSATGAA